MWNWNNTRLLTACTIALLASAPAHALIISKSNTNQVVVDGGLNDFATRIVDFNAGDFSGAADDLVRYLTVEIDFAKCEGPLADPLSSIPLLPALGCSSQLNAERASVNQIGFSLTDPFGTMINLVFPETSIIPGTYSDTSPGGRIQVTFDDAEFYNPLGEEVGFSTPSFKSGTYFTAEPLSSVIGHFATGAWTLAITNTGAGDAPLGVARFTVNVTVNEKQDSGITVPEPASTALLGLGLACVMAFRRPTVF